MPIQHWSPRIWVVQLAEEPLLSEELAAAFEQVKAQPDPWPSMVLNLAGLTHLNSSNLSQLLRLRQAMISHDCRLILAAVPDGLWPVFLLTGLDKVFAFGADVPTALAGLQLKS